MKILKWLGIILGGLIVLLFIFINLMGPRFRMSDKRITKHFEKAKVDYAIHKENFCGKQLRWVESGNLESKTLMLFFHGAPGGFGDFADYMIDQDLVKSTHMVTVDRLGYGYSEYGKAEPSIIKQAEAFKCVLDQFKADSIILVGYSYGGPISGAFAARYPEKLKALLMLAPVNHPEAEKIFWFNPVIKTRVAKWLLPRMIEVANVEKLSHAEALNAIREDWSNIQVPVVHMHCTDDWIAPFEANSNWSKQHFSEDQLELISWAGNSHFLPIHVMERVKPVMLELVER